MTYERPELVLVDAAEAAVLGGPWGMGDSAGTAPHEYPDHDLALGLDE